MAKITTKEATIKTLSVEVRALTIGSKQVTLAVFRQLPARQIIDPKTGELRGVPWGRVNYHPGDCQGAGPAHLHVVWQDAGELFRACVDPVPKHGEEGIYVDGLARLIYHAIEAARCIRGLSERPLQIKETCGPGNVCVYAYQLGPWKMRDTHRRADEDAIVEYWRTADRLNEFRASSAAERAKSERILGYTPEELDQHYAAQVDQARAKLVGFIDEARQELAKGGFPLSASASVNEADTLLERAKQKKAAMVALWAGRYNDLASLDQLFIAV